MSKIKQFSTFYISDRLYGIDVMCVQEITRKMPMTLVPLAPKYVHGLINLRGQICTAIALRELFGIDSKMPDEFMNVVCLVDEMLVSFLVDRIGDVIEVDQTSFSPTPDVIPDNLKQYMSGVHQLERDIMSILDVEKIIKSITQEDHLHSLDQDKKNGENTIGNHIES